MQWEFLVALAIVIPVILLPAALVWYFNGGGILRAIGESIHGKKTARSKALEVQVKA